MSICGLPPALVDGDFVDDADDGDFLVRFRGSTHAMKRTRAVAGANVAYWHEAGVQRLPGSRPLTGA